MSDLGLEAYSDDKMRHFITRNGPLSRKAVSTKDKLVETQPWMVVVHLPNEEAYQQVLAFLKDTPKIELELYPERHSLGWGFDGKTEDELTAKRLNDLSQRFPEILFECYKYDVGYEKEHDEVQSYASFRKDKVRWFTSYPSLLSLMHGHRMMDLSYEEIIFNHEQVFRTVLDKARSGEEGYPHMAAEYLFWETSLHLLQAEDFKWLKALAEDADVAACCLLMLGMDRKIQEWEELFIDEDTNEEVTITRTRVIDGSLFEPDETLIVQLEQTIYDLAANHPIDDDIRNAYWYLRDPAPVLFKLAERNDDCAIWALYLRYYNGDEKHGFFIDRKRAREYYDLALKHGCELDDWDDEEDLAEEDPYPYEYVLTGDPATLDNLQALINSLCQRFGTPDSEFGLNVPQRQLMKELVGSDTEFYRGNVIQMIQEAPDRLVITTEADDGDPLLYALRYCYKNLNVEINN